MQPLYMTDSYIREHEAKVVEITPEGIVLDDTIFYPTGGGQPNDLGKIVSNGREFDVVNVTKNTGKIVHHIQNHDISVGDTVKCVLDWNRRYRLMRMHTSAHIIDAVLYQKTGALTTGNQLGVEKTRIDFSLEVLDTEKIKSYIQEANEIIGRNVNVKIYFLKREEALKIPGIVKLANAMPPNVDALRIVEIPGIDTQADGGTQVMKTGEIGEIELISIENKGKQNRRIYYTLK